MQIKINKRNSILFITILFIISLILKWEYVGSLSEGHHQFGTGITKIVVENWIKDGITNNKFLRVMIPDSIEYSNIYERVIYFSYPHGTDFLIYFFKNIFKSTETLKIIHLSSATFHYFIALFIFLFISRIKFNLKYEIILTFAVITSISYIFLPIPFYYHLMLFSFDEPIILPFVIILYLEYLIRTKKKNKYFILQSLTFFLAGFLDYFCIIVGASIFFFRLIVPIKNFGFFKSIIQIMPAGVPFFIHLYHLYENNLLTDLFERLTRRTGIDYVTGKMDKSKSYDSYIYHFWIKKLHIYLPLVVGSIFFLIKNFFITKDKNYSFLVLIIGFFSCILYSFIFQDLVAVHDFATIKFYPLLAITLFAIIPLRYIEIINSNAVKKITLLTSFFLIFLIIADNSIRLIYYSKININENYVFYHKKFYKNFILSQFPYPKVENEEILKKIREISEYNDVYLSFTNFYVDVFPPQKLSISKKIVNKIDNIDNLIKKIEVLPKNANIKIIVENKNLCIKNFQKNKKIEVNNTYIINIEKKEVDKINKCL